MCEKSAKNGVSNINQTLFNKEVIMINKLIKLDKMFTVKRRIIYFTKYKQDLFVRNSVASNKNSLPSSRDQRMIRHSFDAMVSRAISNAFVLEVTIRTNKSYLYFVNNDSSFHSKHSIKLHQFIDNNNFFKLNNVWLDTPFFATFSHIQKYAAEFEH